MCCERALMVLDESADDTPDAEVGRSPDARGVDLPSCDGLCVS